MAEVLDHRLEWAPGALTPPTVRCGDKKYTHFAHEELYSLVASLPAGYPEPIYELYQAGQTAHRLVASVYSGPGFVENMLKEHSARIMQQFSRMLDDSATTRAHATHAHFFHDESTSRLTAVFPEIFVEGKVRDTLPWCVIYLNRLATESANRIYTSDEIGSSRDIQPMIREEFQLPNTGTMKYKWSMKTNGHEFVQDKRLLAKESMPWLSNQRGDREIRQRLILKLGGLRGGLKISRNFDTFMKTYNRRAQSGVEHDHDLANYNGEEDHFKYKLKLSEQLETCIDLSDSSAHWAPNQGARFACALLEKIRADTRESPHMLFPSACNFMNQFLAKQRAPGAGVWVKVRIADTRAAGCALEKYTLEQFIKNSGISLEFESPVEPTNVDRCLRGVKINKETGKYSWIEWFFRYGCREVSGTRFIPLSLGERITDESHADYINTFQGFRCQRWMNEDPEQCQRWFDEQTEDFKFLLEHIKNICGGDDSSADIRHAWNALLCYCPSYKPPMWIINQGPAGCGKSSFEEAFGEFMLNKAHIRKVMAIEALVGHFNADSADKCLTVIEEMDFKDAKAKAMNALQELVTCKELRGEPKGVDAAMRADYQHFIANTNVEAPAVLPKDQRRLMLNRFAAHIAHKMRTDSVYKKEYLVRLARVLKTEHVWKAYAHFLFAKYASSPERIEEVKVSMETRREFNWDTTKLQIASMVMYAETSVLGWLFREMSRFTPLTPVPADSFVYQHDPTDLKFWEWKCWKHWNATNHPIAAQFPNHNWKLAEERYTNKWWHKETRANVYQRYSSTLRSVLNAHNRSAILDESEFFAELSRLLNTTDPLDPLDQPKMLEHAESVPQKNYKGEDSGYKAVEWVCFAPFTQLRTAVRNALNPSWNFTWEAFYDQAK